MRCMRMLFALLSLLSTPLTTIALAADAPPNILLILSDDHSAAHVGCYGNADGQTPTLDKLAAAA